MCSEPRGLVVRKLWFTMELSMSSSGCDALPTFHGQIGAFIFLGVLSGKFSPQGAVLSVQCPDYMHSSTSTLLYACRHVLQPSCKDVVFHASSGIGFATVRYLHSILAFGKVFGGCRNQFVCLLGQQNKFLYLFGNAGFWDHGNWTEAVRGLQTSYIYGSYFGVCFLFSFGL